MPTPLNCCLNRPFDEQTQDLIRLETEAKLIIQRRIKAGDYSLVWSFMLDSENDENPYDDKRAAIEPWRKIAAGYCTATEEVRDTAKTYMQLGVKHKDAIHLACAVISGCDYFISTDVKLLKKRIDGIKLVNPVAFILEMEGMK
jgi:hypothetical protein